jgi:type IV fimbrial biogenesis protein FimT
MLVTMAIAGILLVIAVPSFRQLILNQGIKTASFDLFSALEYTRSEAIKRPADVVLLCAGNTTANNGAWATGWRLGVTDCSSNPLRSWTTASKLAITEKAGGATSITFAKDGHMTAPATAPKLQIDPATSLAGVTSRCVQVDLVGRPRTQIGACS